MARTRPMTLRILIIPAGMKDALLEKGGNEAAREE